MEINMYRINDTMAATAEIQRYLLTVGDGAIPIVPTGVYDNNTRLAIIEFQERSNIEATGAVDYETFTLLYSEYSKIIDERETKAATLTFIRFPLSLGARRTEMIHINDTLGNLLDYYGHAHNLRYNDRFSRETASAVKILRGIYLLGDSESIDEEFYKRMTDDHRSIGEFTHTE